MISDHDALDFWKGEDRARLAANIDAASHHAGLLLRRDGHAYVALEPGDMTSYPVMLIWDGLVRFEGDTVACEPNRKRLIASLATPRVGAGGYEVGGGWLHPSYVAEKWLAPGRSRDSYTAHVLARFLEGVREVVAP